MRCCCCCSFAVAIYRKRSLPRGLHCHLPVFVSGLTETRGFEKCMANETLCYACRQVTVSTGEKNVRGKCFNSLGGKCLHDNTPTIQRLEWWSTFHCTCPCCTVCACWLSGAVKSVCVCVSPVCVFVCDRSQLHILNLCETPSIILSNTPALMAKWMKRLPT